MNVAGFFSGIGGLELGFHKDPWRTIFMCENDILAQEVLKQRFNLNEDSLVSDITQLDQLPEGIDVVLGGFPCQDVSSSGRKAGMEGGRSSLISHLMDLVEPHAPSWIILENVPFMLQLKQGQVIRYVTSRLSEMGYRWAYRTINTQAFGLPQRRRRVFLVASRTHDPKEVLYADEAGSVQPTQPTLEKPVGFYWTEGRYSTGLTHNGIPPLKAGSTVGIPSPPAILLPSGLIGKPSIEDAEALQGFERGWTQPAERVGRATLRWRLIGNAVSVPISHWIASRILERGGYDGQTDPTFTGKSSWPSAAWSDEAGEVRVSNRSEWPLHKMCDDLTEYAQHLTPLSERATRGFLKRLQSANLWRPEGFEDALNAHLKSLG